MWRERNPAGLSEAPDTYMSPASTMWNRDELFPTWGSVGGSDLVQEGSAGRAAGEGIRWHREC